MGYSRFYLCDLQVNTPADHNHRYGDFGGREPNPAFAAKLIEAAASQGVSVIAVADHNRVDWFPVVRDAAAGRGVYVFPGLEFSVDGCHLLALWDRTDEGFDLARRFLESLFRPGESPFSESGQPRPVTQKQVLEWARSVSDHGGLTFAPHTTSKDIGLFAKNVCRSSSEVARSGFVAGFDVCGNGSADVLTNPRAEFGDTPPRWFICGDVRSFDDVGTQAVYLKLGDPPTLEGIRQAFLAPTTRVRFPEAHRRKWGHVRGVQFLAEPKPAWPRLTSISIEGGFHDGISIELASGLNAVIGGKGSGKSALLEIVRYCADAGQSSNGDLIANLKRNFRANAEATLGFVGRDGEQYTAKRSGSGSQAILFRGDKETEVPVHRRLRLRVFGQRELQALADRQEDMRDFVAAQAGSSWDEASKEESDHSSRLDQLDRSLSQWELSLVEMREQASELADLDERLQQARERGADSLIGEMEVRGEADRLIREATDWPDAVEQQLIVLKALSKHPPLPDHEDVPSTLSGRLEKISSSIQRAVDDVEGALAGERAGLGQDKALWESTQEHAQRDFAVRLAEAGISDPGDLAKIQEKARILRAKIAGLPQTQKEYDKAQREWKQALAALHETRRKRSRILEDAARRLTQVVGKRVRLTVEPLGDTSQILAVLEKATKGEGLRKDQLVRLAALGNDLAELVREGSDALVARGASGTTSARLVQLPGCTLREVERAPLTDIINVEVDLGPAGDPQWTPVGRVSPGQRATALLAMALAAGDEPLIIDQPEDDLDNRYIYEEVVKVMAEVCTRRQVIVATHNANIPILGDAELIIALDATADQSRLLAIGGLEEPDVAERARAILEGGDEAFRARQQRYLAAAPAQPVQ